MASKSPQYEIRIFAVLKRLMRSLDIHSRRLVASHDITGPQLLCLIAVSEQDGEITTSELADAVHVSPSTVVGIIDRLEGKKLLKRARCKADRRVVHLQTTRQGEELASEVGHPLRDGLADALRAMTKAEREQLTLGLEKLAKLMGLLPEGQ